MIAGLSSTLPQTMRMGLTRHGLPAAAAAKIANLPPVGSLFAAFLGYNPMKTMLGPALHKLPAQQAHTLTSRSFFPQLISGPFMHGLTLAFILGIAMCALGAAASWMRGRKYVHDEEAAPAVEGEAA
jgi:hypothetical protein